MWRGDRNASPPAWTLAGESGEWLVRESEWGEGYCLRSTLTGREVDSIRAGIVATIMDCSKRRIKRKLKSTHERHYSGPWVKEDPEAGYATWADRADSDIGNTDWMFPDDGTPERGKNEGRGRPKRTGWRFT